MLILTYIPVSQGAKPAGAKPGAGTRPLGDWPPGAPQRANSASLHPLCQLRPPGRRNTHLKPTAKATELLSGKIQM